MATATPRADRGPGNEPSLAQVSGLLALQSSSPTIPFYRTLWLLPTSRSMGPDTLIQLLNKTGQLSMET